MFGVVTIYAVVAVGSATLKILFGGYAFFLDGEAALPRWLKIRELQDLKEVVSQSVVVVLLIAFLGDVLEWEQGSDIALVGGGIAAVIAAVAFMLRTSRTEDRRP
jgi:uncharacterized membrane protein YqhA